jgi:branched-chain amino acid transport system permease protein
MAWPAFALAVLVCVVTVASSALPADVTESAKLGLIDMVLVVGLYVWVGNSGIVSFGQVSFSSVGAYTAGLITMPTIAKHALLPTAPIWLQDLHASSLVSLPVAGLAGALVAMIVGVALLRMTGMAAGLATMALLVIVYVFFKNWSVLGVGQGSLPRIPVDTDTTTALVCGVGAIGVAYWYQISRFGLQLRAVRDDGIAAQAAGINVYAQRVYAFVLSGFLMGLGGGLYAHFIGSISPSAFYFDLTLLTLAMLVVGGMRSLTGAVTGTIVIATIGVVVGRFQNGLGIGPLVMTLPQGSQGLVVAAIMMGVIAFRPQGIVGSRELPPPRWFRTDDVEADSNHRQESTEPGLRKTQLD